MSMKPSNVLAALRMKGVGSQSSLARAGQAGKAADASGGSRGAAQRQAAAGEKRVASTTGAGPIAHRAHQAAPAAALRSAAAETRMTLTQPPAHAPNRIALEEAMDTRVRQAGLGGALGVEPTDEWTSGVGLGRVLVAQLRENHRRRIMATWNLSRIGAALSWWEEFTEVTERVPFKAMANAGELAASVYNNTTLDLFAEYVRGRGSRRAGRRGETLSADYIASTVTTIRLLRSGQAHYDVAPAVANTARPTMFKEMRTEDGPLAARRASYGFRAQDFRAIADTYDRHSRVGVMEWSMAHGAHSMLLRPGEIGHMQRKVFDAARGISIASVTERAPCADSAGLPWITIDVTAIKDTQARHRPVPIPIRQRAEGNMKGGDPTCAYTAIMAQYKLRCIEVPACAGACEWCQRVDGMPRPRGKPPAVCARSNAPLFADAAGQALNTKAVKAIGMKMATAAGIDKDGVAGRLWRVGGATDLRETMGMAGAAMIKERGRWHSDIAFIYARALIGQQMTAAANMANAVGAEVERAVRDWVQPAAFR